MTPRKLILVIVSASGICASATTFAEAVTCPARFPMKLLRFEPADEGWSASLGDSAAPLESVGLFSGPPVERAELIPTSSNGTRVTWQLEGPIPEGLWLQCNYGRNALSLSRPLQGAPKACIAKYGKERAFQPRSIDFSCR